MDTFERVILTFCSAVALLFVAYMAYSVSEHRRLVKQCVDDGHREYECHAMLDEHLGGWSR